MDVPEDLLDRKEHCPDCDKYGFPAYMSGEEIVFKCCDCGSEWKERGSSPDITPFLKIPANELTEDEKACIAIKGMDSFKRILANRVWSDGLEWPLIAQDAVGMYLTGKYTQKQIADHFGVDKADLLKHVDLSAVRRKLQGDVAAKSYQMALEGNETMIKHITERQMGWKKESKVEHGGVVGLQPVLNIGVKTLDKPDIEVEYEENTSND